MRGHADGALRCLGAIGVMMGSERDCRPQHQQEANHSNELNFGPHACYPTNLFFDCTPKREFMTNQRIEDGLRNCTEVRVLSNWGPFPPSAGIHFRPTPTILEE